MRMSTRSVLPAPFSHRPFAVRDALASGIPASRLRARDLNPVYWGTRASQPSMLSLRQTCATLQSRLPENAHFSHSTVALLLGAPLPRWLERSPLLHLTVPSPHRALHAAGIVGHKLQLADADTTVRDGIRTTTAARTWCDLATMLKLAELVAVGDYLIHWRMPLTTEADLRRSVVTHRGRRGRVLLRTAIELLSAEAESPQESILRVILVQGGLPLPQINRSLVEADGTVFARLDLRYSREKVAIEYQGDYHRTSKDQWRKDMSRRARLEAKGWYVIELNADDLREPEKLVALIRSILFKRRPATR